MPNSLQLRARLLSKGDELVIHGGRKGPRTTKIREIYEYPDRIVLKTSLGTFNLAPNQLVDVPTYER